MYSELRSHGADLLSVAVDLQGPDLPRPYHEQAGAEFTTVVDEANDLGSIFGYRAIPNGFMIDEAGRVRWQHHGGFNVKDGDTAAAVMHFAATGEVPGEAGKTDADTPYDHFERGLELYRAGDLEGAKGVWREGSALDPSHWNMRKQLWAIEHPERFYDGAVDYGWQKEQVEAGT